MKESAKALAPIINLPKEIRDSLKGVIPSLTKARLAEWVRLHFCIGSKLSTLGITDFVLIPSDAGDALRIQYVTRHPGKKAAKEREAEIKDVRAKICRCLTSIPVKKLSKFQIAAYRNAEDFFPRDGGGDDEPLCSSPRLGGGPDHYQISSCRR